MRAVIFDLDGTLVQTRVASWAVFAKVNERFGLGITRPEEYFDLFRGNVFASIARLAPDRAAEVREAFLDLLREEYTPPIVPGMAEVVRRLAGACTLAVLSSNATQVLRRVLVGNDLAFCFAHVFGGDVAPDKRVAIETFLADSGNVVGRRCAADYDEAGVPAAPTPATTVLVTDTAGDVRDARAAGIRAVGVAWGMHSVGELTDAGAEFVALWPQELSAHLLGDAATAPPAGACALPPSPKDCGCGCAGTRLPTRAAPSRGDEATDTFAWRDEVEGPTRGDGTAPPPGRNNGAEVARYGDAAAAGAVRRARRRAAAHPPPVRSAPPVAAELLAAVRRVCGRG